MTDVVTTTAAPGAELNVAPSPAPRKPAPTTRGLRREITLTLPPALVIAIDDLAAARDQTRARIIELALRRFVEANTRGSAR